MKLNQIPKKGLWDGIADFINENFNKIDTSVESLKDATVKNCGYFSTLEALQQAYPKAGAGSKAYVGANHPYAIYLWNTASSAWVDSGATGGEENVELEDYYTKEDIDASNAAKRIAFELEAYIRPDGTLVGGASAWRTTNKVAVLPNMRLLYRGIGMAGSVLNIAFYDLSNRLVGAVESNEDINTWKEVSVIVPKNAYFVRACTTIIKDSAYKKNEELLIILPEEGSNMTAELDDYMRSRVGLYLYDCNLSNGSLRRDASKNLVLNSFNNDIVSTYSSIILYLPNRNKFANIRATNVVIPSNQALVLSKSPTSIERFSSVDEIPFGSASSNVYVHVINPSSYFPAWDVIFGNYNGQINPFISTNLKVFEDAPTAEDFAKGIFVKNANLFTEGLQGYITLNGVFVATPSVKWFTSDKIDVFVGQRLRGQGYGQTSATPLVAMYDNSGKYLSAVSILSTKENGGVEPFDIVIPDSVSFVKLLSYNNSDTYVIEMPKQQLSVNEPKFKYSHSLKRPYDFSGKFAKFFGDSVTYGVSTNPWTNPLAECYRRLFCQYAGLTGSNEAVSGSFIYDPEYDGVTSKTSSILSQVRTKVVDDNQDFIFVAGGINDFWTGKPLGKITDDGNVSFYGALKEICAHIKSVAPSANVIFLTPINYSKTDGDSRVAALNEYRNAIFEIAVMNGFSVVDMSVVGFPKDAVSSPYRTAMIGDGVHPTALGHKMMAENLYSILGK